MACKITDLKEDDIISVWLKGELPVRGEIKGFAGGNPGGTPKFIKAWLKEQDMNVFRREIGDTLEDEPKIFYLSPDQVTKVVINPNDLGDALRACGFSD